MYSVFVLNPRLCIAVYVRRWKIHSDTKCPHQKTHKTARDAGLDAAGASTCVD
jgi:hypothetical protein